MRGPTHSHTSLEGNGGPSWWFCIALLRQALWEHSDEARETPRMCHTLRLAAPQREGEAVASWRV